MPRYHFNVHDGTSLRDEEGTELPDLTAARRCAAQYAGALLQEQPDTFWNGEHWRMDVTDGAGLILFTLTFFANDGLALGSR